MLNLVASHQDEAPFLVDSGDIHDRQSRSASLEARADSAAKGFFGEHDHQYCQQAHGGRHDRHPDD
ncbi:hypothetical protein [Aurantimonas sp. E1-2-R+4]|uniref:hypothetical protein n=1 Tax=Aurantimonas sp. E1-2-R+4 TaxID=3113714 RepID=UPI002F940254